MGNLETDETAMGNDDGDVVYNMYLDLGLDDEDSEIDETDLCGPSGSAEAAA